MSDLTLMKLEPVLRNRDAFTRKDVANIVMRLGYTKDRVEAYKMVDRLIGEALRTGDAHPLDGMVHKTGPLVRRTACSYRLQKKENDKQLLAMFSLLLQTQEKLAAAETKIQNLLGRKIHVA